MEKTVKSARAYRSERRDSQARETRRAVVAAARGLFIEAGYGATTMQEIADRAGVSVQTVYAVFRNKRAVLDSALDTSIAGDDEPVAINDRDWMHAVFTHPDPAVRLASYAAAVCRIHDAAADMFAVVRAAAACDPDLRSFAEMTESRRRAGASSVVAGLIEIGGLRSGLDELMAVDILWMLNSADVFLLLVRRSGWSLERFELWLAQTMQEQLLGQYPAAGTA